MEDEFIGIVLVVFCVMGFSANLFVRSILIYLDWRNGETINWWNQFLYVFGLPAVFIFAISESMAVLGFFSSEPAVFDFQKQTK
jgi:predicted permease